MSAMLKRIYAEDQLDRRAFLYEKNPKLFDRRDKARLRYILERIEKRTLKTPSDYFYAAMILQHGPEIGHYKLAHEFALKAAKEGFVPASSEADPLWLAAAAKDRSLMSQGKPQLYGTQFRRDSKYGLWYVYPVDPGITDKERKRYHVPTLRNMYKMVETKNMNELIGRVKTYLGLLDSRTGTKWNRGYYWSAKKTAQNYERYFLRTVPKFEKEIRKFLRVYPENKKAIYWATALGWGKNRTENRRVLVSLLSAKSHLLHNYAMRALFPLVVTRKISFNIDEALKLLQHKNPYCKNKALGTLAFIPLKKKELRLLSRQIPHFRKLSKNTRPVISRPAKILLKRIETKI